MKVFMLEEGMILNIKGTIFKVKRVRKNGKITLKYKGIALPPKQAKPKLGVKP